MTIAQAYRVCRGIARREARNFYFAFLALPPRKRDAICAVYAFMRAADDLSDDERIARPERRARMAAWLAAWHAAARNGQTADPVFLALNDARVRFRIPLSLLDQLVEGTAIDLREEHDDAQTFADFPALRRYCYLVASVVGLVCIRIFGYRSPRAEALAEELGIALQLTNILRDVREDAERGRVYLPVDELAQHGLTPEALMAAARQTAPPSAALRALLREQARRAEEFYGAGEALLPLITPDSRPALWVLMTIYHRLLGRIHQADYDVFSQRASVPTGEKLLLLARGLARTLLVRLRPTPRCAIQHFSVSATGPGRRVAIVGAGVAGLAAGCALAEAGYDVTVFERRPYVGGRASSYLHPGSGETIDNCQHILLGCCTNLRSLLGRVGRAGDIGWTRSITYIEPGGRRSTVQPTALPAPLHAAPSFLRARCFAREDKQAIARALRQFLHGYPADVPGGESFLAWAQRNGQTAGALKRFWEPILQSALNDDLDRISLHYAGMVIRDSFMNSAEAGSIGVPLLPLSEFYRAAADYVEQRGGTLRLRTGIRALEPADGGWKLHLEDGASSPPVFFDQVVLALPFEAAGGLLATLPPDPERDRLLAAIHSFEHAPLAGVHLWFDREITELPHAVLLDATIQWMYQREKLSKGREGQGSHLELVISAARSVLRMSQPEIVALALRELASFFPAVREANLLKSVVTKEVRATFTVPPGVDARRPAARTAWPGLYLAGDWTDTGWPATMEGAARSGFLAAEAVTGGEAQFLVPDLPPRGLMRFFST